MSTPDASSVRIGCIGDVHGAFDRLERVVTELREEGLAAILMTGDFLGPYAGDVAAASRTVCRQALGITAAVQVPVLYVPGNHDTRNLREPGNVDGTQATVDGVRFAGIGGSGPHRFGFPYEWSEDEIRALELPETDVLLSHTPPARTRLDRLHYGGEHVGSEAVRERAEAHRGVLVCGHIHESAGAEVLSDCLCYNAGALGAPYARSQYGILEIRPPAARIVHRDLDRGESWTASAP